LAAPAAPEIVLENPFAALDDMPQSDVWEVEAPSAPAFDCAQHAFGSAPTEDELQPLLDLGAALITSSPAPNGNDEQEVSDDFNDDDDEEQERVQDEGEASMPLTERGLASYAWSMDDSYVWLSGSADVEPSAPLAEQELPAWQAEESADADIPLIKSISLSTLLAEEEAVQLAPSHCEPLVELPTREEEQDGDRRIVVKLYVDEGNIHRFSVPRGQLSFERLQERVAHNLLQRLDAPAECRAYAVTYEDEEGDRIAVCSQEELEEALRVYETYLWADLQAGDLPIMRIHVRPVTVGPEALNNGYILA